MTLEPTLTSGEVARLFGVNRQTVTRWARRGLLPSVRTPGGHHRYQRTAVEAHLRPALNDYDQQQRGDDRGQ